MLFRWQSLLLLVWGRQINSSLVIGSSNLITRTVPSPYFCRCSSAVQCCASPPHHGPHHSAITTVPYLQYPTVVLVVSESDDVDSTTERKHILYSTRLHLNRLHLLLECSCTAHRVVLLYRTYILTSHDLVMINIRLSFVCTSRLRQSSTLAFQQQHVFTPVYTALYSTSVGLHVVEECQIYWSLAGWPLLDIGCDRG